MKLYIAMDGLIYMIKNNLILNYKTCDEIIWKSYSKKFEDINKQCAQFKKPSTIERISNRKSGIYDDNNNVWRKKNYKHIIYRCILDNCIQKIIIMTGETIIGRNKRNNKIYIIYMVWILKKKKIK